MSLSEDMAHSGAGQNLHGPTTHPRAEGDLCVERGEEGRCRTSMSVCMHVCVCVCACVCMCVCMCRPSFSEGSKCGMEGSLAAVGESHDLAHDGHV